MNEVLIRNIIRYKLTTAEKILDKLPPKVSNNLKNFGKIVIESINESSKEIKNQPSDKEKSTDKLNNIKIE